MIKLLLSGQLSRLVTTRRSGRRRDLGSIPDRRNRHIFSNGTGICPWGWSRVRRKTDHTPNPAQRFKNECNFTTTYPCAFLACSEIDFILQNRSNTHWGDPGRVTVWQKKTPRKRSKNGGDGGTGIYMRRGTTWGMMAADKSYGEFCNFYSVSPEYFGYDLVHNYCKQRMWWCKGDIAASESYAV
jgi:hypothetical protein